MEFTLSVWKGARASTPLDKYVMRLYHSYCDTLKYRGKCSMRFSFKNDKLADLYAKMNVVVIIEIIDYHS